jgi:transposase
MRQKTVPVKQPVEEVIRDIRRAARRHFSAQEKTRIVLEGLRGEESIAEICPREENRPLDVLRLVQGVP